MSDDERDDETTARLGGEGPRELSGELLGARWSFRREGEHAVLTVGGRDVHLRADGVGSWVTHAMVGRWRDPAELARAILLFHPDYSPLAGRSGGRRA